MVISSEEILGLDADARDRMTRWVHRGGRLFVTGKWTRAVIGGFFPGDAMSQTSAQPLGLGEIVPANEAAIETCGSKVVDSCNLIGPAGRLAGSTTHGIEASRPRAAMALLCYGFLILAGFIMTTPFAPAWRAGGAAALVGLFFLWPPWTVPTIPDRQRWSQVDVAVDIDGGSAIAWSAAAYVSPERRSVALEVDAEDCRMQVLASRGLAGEVAIDEEIGEADCQARTVAEASADARLELGWLAGGNLEHRLELDIDPAPGEVVGLIRNRFMRSWADAWLLMPDAEPRRVADLAPGEAVLVEPPGSGNGGHSGASDERGRSMHRPDPERMWTELPPERGRLLASTYGCAIRPLLDRGLPVLVGWSPGPILPARTGSGENITSGWTLLVAAGNARL
jgi:hypothetical protein